MKTLAITALALLLPAGALAQYEPAEVHVVVSLGSHVSGLAAAEFRIIDLPWDFCLIEQAWDSPLTIGNIDYGFAIAFTELQSGPLVHLGTLTITAFEPAGDDYVMWVYPSLQSNQLVIVNENYEEVVAVGWFHAFNCQDWCDCMYPDDGKGPAREDPQINLWAVPDEEICDQELPVYPTTTAGSSWGAVKALY